MGKDPDQLDFLVILNISLVDPLPLSCDVIGPGTISFLIILATDIELHKTYKTEEITSNFQNNNHSIFWYIKGRLDSNGSFH